MRLTSRAIWIALGITLPMLGLGSCANSVWGPLFYFDPLTRALLEAPEDPNVNWRSVSVDLMPDVLETSTSESALTNRMKASGFEKVPVSMPGGEDTYMRWGRSNFACGEHFIIAASFIEDEWLTRQATAAGLVSEAKRRGPDV